MMQISLSEHEDGLVDNSIPKPKKQQVRSKKYGKILLHNRNCPK